MSKHILSGLAADVSKPVLLCELQQITLIAEWAALPPDPWNQKSTGIGVLTDEGVISEMQRWYLPSDSVTTCPPAAPFTEHVGVLVAFNADAPAKIVVNTFTML